MLRKPDLRDHLGFLAEAMEADARDREALWRSLEGKGEQSEAELHKALLRTLPGHSGYEPALARSSLEKLMNEDATSDVALVARVRLHELQGAMACGEEVKTLRKRLAAVADIERQLDRTEP